MGFWKYVLGFDPNRMRLFPGQQPGEEIELMTLRHWVQLIPLMLQIIFLLSFLIWANIMFAEMFNVSEPIVFFTNSVVVSVLVHVFFMKFYNHFLKVVIITNHRVMDIRNTIFFHRDQETIPMTNIQDFRVRQDGIFARFFKYGDLVIIGANTEIKYQLKCVPNVNMVQHLLAGLHQIMIMEQRGQIQQQRQNIIASPQLPLPEEP